MIDGSIVGWATLLLVAILNKVLPNVVPHPFQLSFGYLGWPLDL